MKTYLYKHNKIAIACIIAIIISSIFYYQRVSSCQQLRIAFDIGSGSFKSEFALVDICENKIIEKIDHYSEPIKLIKCMKFNENNEKYLDDACIDKAVNALKITEEKYKVDCKNAHCVGVATEWARQVINSDKLFEKLHNEGLKIWVIDQKTEGLLALDTVTYNHVNSPIPQSSVAVWDVGGGSFQLSTLDEENDLHVFGGKFGVETFELAIRTAFDKPRDAEKPYFAEAELPKVLVEAKKLVNCQMIKESEVYKLLKTQNKGLFAVGRPFTQVNYKELDIPLSFTKKDLMENLLKFCDRNEEEVFNLFPKLAPHFARSTQISLILMYTILDCLEVENAKVSDTNMTEIIFLKDVYWK